MSTPPAPPNPNFSKNSIHLKVEALEEPVRGPAWALLNETYRNVEASKIYSMATHSSRSWFWFDRWVMLSCAPPFCPLLTLIRHSRRVCRHRLFIGRDFFLFFFVDAAGRQAGVKKGMLFWLFCLYFFLPSFVGRRFFDSTQ